MKEGDNIGRTPSQTGSHSGRARTQEEVETCGAKQGETHCDAGCVDCVLLQQIELQRIEEGFDFEAC